MGSQGISYPVRLSFFFVSQTDLAYLDASRMS